MRDQRNIANKLGGILFHGNDLPDLEMEINDSTRPLGQVVRL
jgi:hypothetical protein